MKHRRNERGQTIVLVALTVVTLLAMAALAIDVVTLYVARAEMQRAADGAALAAAKAFVDSGVTTDPTNTTRQTLATDMATALINSTIQHNKIGGVQATLVGTPTPDFTRNGNPQITVTLQRTNLPMFFARIWGSRAMTVTASATAEAYNPSSSQTNTGSYVPIQPRCVKPLLLANLDPSPGGTGPIVDAATGAVLANLIGKQVSLGPSGCQGGAPANPCVPSAPPPPTLTAGNFLPAEQGTATQCPACQGGSTFEQSIECCDSFPYQCGASVTTNNPRNLDTIITTGQVRTEARAGLQCLINRPSQDTIDGTDLLSGIGPARITAQSGPNSGNLVTTSRSIAVFPIITLPLTSNTNAQVIGFLHVFIEGVNSVGALNITATVLNVVGCGNNPSGGQPVLGGADAANPPAGALVSADFPIPVRLIH